MKINKTWYQKNKERAKKQALEWKKNNKEKKKEYDKKWYQKNKEKYKEWNKQWRLKNKEHKKEYMKEYYLKNLEKIKAYRFKNRKREKENKERWRLKNPEKIKEYAFKNKEKIKIKSKKYYLKNIERVKTTVKKYINSEHGHFVLMWHRLKKHRYGNDFKNFEEFFQHWLDQKAIYGMTCPATGVKMTVKRKNLLNANQDPNSNLVSGDRILNNKGYSKQNVIFTTWAYNKRKGSVTPEDAIVFLKIVKKRYGTDEI